MYTVYANERLTRIYTDEKDVSSDEAENWMKQQIADQNYVLDVWVNS